MEKKYNEFNCAYLSFCFGLSSGFSAFFVFGWFLEGGFWRRVGFRFACAFVGVYTLSCSFYFLFCVRRRGLSFSPFYRTHVVFFAYSFLFAFVRR
jgi:hypothetical protein